MKLLFYPGEIDNAIRYCFRKGDTLLFGRSFTQLLQEFGRRFEHGSISKHDSRFSHRDVLLWWLLFFHATTIAQGGLIWQSLLRIFPHAM